jgi:hypothetical protein
MHTHSTALIVIGVILLIGGLLWRATGKNTTIKNSKGNFIGGNVRGQVTQTYTGDTTIGSGDGSKVGAKEIIAWLIAIAGLVITALGVYHTWISSHP